MWQEIQIYSQQRTHAKIDITMDISSLKQLWIPQYNYNEYDICMTPYDSSHYYTYVWGLSYILTSQGNNYVKVILKTFITVYECILMASEKPF